MPQPPNILLIMADQLRFDCIGALNPALRTPNLDRLCAEGTLFERCFSASPVCLPSRCSTLTGQFPSTHRACHNHTELSQDHPALLSRSLRDRGYYTHLVGKSHFSNCHDPCSAESAPHIHNLEYWRRWHGPWYGFERAGISIGHTAEAHACGMHYGAWLADHGIDRKRYFGNHGYTDFGPWDLPERYTQTAWVADTTIEGIRRAGDRSQPFFLWANFADPHNPCLVPEPWASMYDPADLPEYGFKSGEPACFGDKPPFYREILAQPGAYAAKPSDPGLRGAGNVSHLDWDRATVQKQAALYYGMISMLDAHLGRILDHLDTTGQRDNTLVVFTSDHGDLLGEHGFFYKSLVAYDGSIRVPLVARLPGQLPSGARNPALQSLVDLFPTFLAAAGAPPEWRAEGRDQWGTWRGGDPVREEVIVEERPYHSDWTQRIWIGEDGWRAAVYPGRDYGELYSPGDPDQIRNLWRDPAHRDRRDRILQRILVHDASRRHPRPDPTGLAAWNWTHGAPEFNYRQLGVIDLE